MARDTDYERPNLLTLCLWGGGAFFCYEVAIAGLTNILRVRRALMFFPVELLVFALTTVALFLYSRLIRSQPADSAVGTKDQFPSSQKDSNQLVTLFGRRVAIFSECIEQSLSAIMFFARSQAVRASSSQLERDLREVMERIDQIQLLLREMQQSIQSGAILEPGDLNSAAFPSPLASEMEALKQVEFRKANKAFSLRKCARKVVILPVSVSYIAENLQMSFHTYTVNVCEDGACIVFSGQNLEDKANIAVRMGNSNLTNARIRWIQPSRENAFRLAGLEFLERAEMRAV